jgi:hypothetical protein
MTREPFQIEFTRSGGFAGISQHAVIDSAKLDPAKAGELEKLLAAVKDAPPTGPGGADRFQYDLKITHGGKETAVTLRDGSLTDEQKRLVAMLTELSKAS